MLYFKVFYFYIINGFKKYFDRMENIIIGFGYLLEFNGVKEIFFILELFFEMF